MVPAVTPDVSGDTRQVSPARKFVFTPAEPQKSHPYSGEREKFQNWRVLVVLRP